MAARVRWLWRTSALAWRRGGASYGERGVGLRYFSEGKLFGGKYRWFDEYSSEKEENENAVMAYNLEIKHLVNEGRTSEALEIIDSMMRKWVEPTEDTFLYMIRAYCKDGKIKEALRWRERMESYGFKISHAKVAKIFLSHEISMEMMERAEITFLSMYEQKFLDKDLYEKLIMGYINVRNMEKATQYVEEMMEAGYTNPSQKLRIALNIEMSLKDLDSEDGIEKSANRVIDVIETLAEKENDRAKMTLVRGCMQEIVFKRKIRRTHRLKLVLNLMEKIPDKHKKHERIYSIVVHIASLAGAKDIARKWFEDMEANRMRIQYDTIRDMLRIEENEDKATDLREILRRHIDHTSAKNILKVKMCQSEMPELIENLAEMERNPRAKVTKGMFLAKLRTIRDAGLSTEIYAFLRRIVNRQYEIDKQIIEEALDTILKVYKRTGPPGKSGGVIDLRAVDWITASMYRNGILPSGQIYSQLIHIYGLLLNFDAQTSWIEAKINASFKLSAQDMGWHLRTCFMAKEHFFAYLQKYSEELKTRDKNEEKEDYFAKDQLLSPLLRSRPQRYMTKSNGLQETLPVKINVKTLCKIIGIIWGEISFIPYQTRNFLLEKACDHNISAPERRDAARLMLDSLKTSDKSKLSVNKKTVHRLKRLKDRLEVSHLSRELIEEMEGAIKVLVDLLKSRSAK